MKTIRFLWNTAIHNQLQVIGLSYHDLTYDTQIPVLTDLSQGLIIRTTGICLEAERKNTVIFRQSHMGMF